LIPHSWLQKILDTFHSYLHTAQSLSR
jgi:hypothetical protein